MGKKMNLRLEDRNTLQLKVTNVLRKAILKGEFEPGERLIQSELAESLNVSRMPIRESLRILETEGLVKVEPHRGAVVRTMKIEDVDEIYELRSTLERLAVLHSVPKLTMSDIRELDRLVTSMAETEDPDEFIESNIMFHHLLIQGCTRSRLRSFIETLWNGFPQHTPTMLPGQMDLSNKEHQQIVDAVKDGDAETAADLVSEHIRRTGNALVESMRK